MRKLSFWAVAVFAFMLMVPATWAQTTSIKGVVKDENGAPVPNAVINMSCKETGRKYSLKTNKNGSYFSLGIQPCVYDVNVTDSSGKAIFTMQGFRVSLAEATLDIDVKKEREMAQKEGRAPEMTEEQKKEQERIEKENTKIKGLNDRLAAAKAASDAGNFDQAVTVLTEATQLDPTRELLWFKLADAQRGQATKATDPAAKKAAYEASVASYQKAISLGGNTKPDVVGGAYNNMGEAYAKSGQTEDAIKAYEQAATVDPTHAGMYYFNEGAVLTNTNKFKEANEAFDKALQADPNRAAAWYWKGANGINLATLGKDGKMIPAEGTVDAFNKYLELEPAGAYANEAKAMLSALGETVQTSFGKAKAAKKK